MLSHLSRLVRFIAYARPLIFCQLLMISIGLSDTVVLGLLGAEELSSGGLINSYVLLLVLIVTGFGIGVLPVNGVAFGKNDITSLEQNFQAGLILFSSFGAIGYLVLSNLNNFLSWTNIPSEVLARVSDYSFLMAVAFIPTSLAIYLRFYLISIEGAQKIDWIFFAAFWINLTLNLLLTGFVSENISFGMPGVAISTVVTELCLILILLYNLLKKQPTGSHLRISLAKTTRASIYRLFSSGRTLGAILGIEALLFTFTHTMMGEQGDDYLAAHSWFLLALNITFVIPVGIAQAASTQLAISKGKNPENPDMRAAADAIVTGFLLPVFIGTIFVLADEALMRLVIGETYMESNVSKIFSRAAHFLPFIATLSGMVVIVASVLRVIEGSMHFRWNVVIGYWGVGIGLSYVLLNFTELHWLGIYFGITLGFGYSLAGLLFEHKATMTQVFAKNKA